jgi:hypothetical protein
MRKACKILSILLPITTATLIFAGQPLGWWLLTALFFTASMSYFGWIEKKLP